MESNELQKILLRTYPKSMHRIIVIIVHFGLYKKSLENTSSSTCEVINNVHFGYILKNIESLIDSIFDEKMYAHETTIDSPRHILNLIKKILYKVSNAYPNRTKNFEDIIIFINSHINLITGLCDETMERNHRIFIKNKNKEKYKLTLGEDFFKF